MKSQEGSNLENAASINWFVRALVLAMVAFLLVMASVAFYGPGAEHARLTGGVITVLCLAAIIALSEAFDNFSLGKLLQISRSLKKKEGEAAALDQKNERLIGLMFSNFSAEQNQAQNSINVHGDYYGSPVRSASASEAADATDEKVDQSQSTTDATHTPVEAAGSSIPAPATTTPQPSAASREINWGRVENLAIEKHLPLTASSNISVMRDVTLASQFNSVDPISDKMEVFDAFAKNGAQEIFIEVRNARSFGPSFRANLYIKLSKIRHYCIARRVDAHLDLLLVKSDFDNYNQKSQELLYRDFSPALKAGLLQIHEIPFSREEMESCFNQPI